MRPSVAAATPAKSRRARYGRFPRPPRAGEVEVLYSKLARHLDHLDNGSLVLLVLNSRAWAKTVGARCRELDAAADPRRAYTAEECEKALLYQRLTGKRTYKAARSALTGYTEARTRQVLGFDRPRDHVPGRRVDQPWRRHMDGVPSDATMSRHRTTRFPEAERAELYAELLLCLVEEHAENFSEFREELRVIGFDGSTHKTVYRPGFKRDKDGNYLADENGERILRVNGWEGGSLTDPRAVESKRGHGMMTVSAHTAEGIPLFARTARIHDHEAAFAVDIVERDLARVRRGMDPEAIGVSTMDSLFATPAIRRAHRKVGYVENTHRQSGASDRPTTREHIDREAARVLMLHGYPNWRVNGLREPFCLCGNGDVFSRPRMLADGTVSLSTEGACSTCGPLHLTSGEWRPTKNPSGFRRINPNDAADVSDADMMLGNPLTYTDKRAEAYGKNRYAQQEGAHGHTTTRFNLFAENAYYRRINQVRLDVTMTYSLIHALTMEARRAKARVQPPTVPVFRAGTDAIPDGVSAAA